MARPLKWDQVEDDRGISRPRMGFGPSSLLTGGRSHADLPAELRGRMADATAQMKAQGRGPRVTLLNGAAVILGSSVLIVVAAILAPGIIVVIVPVCMLGVVALWAILPPTERLKHEQSIIDTLLAEGYCVSCGYELSGLPVEADGCTVCPECRAAWRMEALASRPRRAEALAHPNPRPDSSGWHWLDFVLPGRRVSLSYRDREGRIVPLIDPTLVRPPAAWKSLEPAVRSRLRRSLWLRHLPLRLLGAGVISWVFLSAVVAGRVPLGNVLGPLAAPVWLLLWYSAIIHLILPARWNREAIASAFVRQGVCASCAARLDEGSTRCSSCGAAW